MKHLNTMLHKCFKAINTDSKLQTIKHGKLNNNNKIDGSAENTVPNGGLVVFPEALHIFLQTRQYHGIQRFFYFLS